MSATPSRTPHSKRPPPSQEHPQSYALTATGAATTACQLWSAPPSQSQISTGLPSAVEPPVTLQHVESWTVSWLVVVEFQAWRVPPSKSLSVGRVRVAAGTSM